MADDTASGTAARWLDRLREPGRYPHPVTQVDVVETHISWVLLAGEYAYKIKKPLDLGFLDFSTLEKRRHCCEEELRLNRRTAAGLYLDVIPVTGSVKDPCWGGNGPAFEYAVRMRRFENSRLADRVASEGHLTEHDVDALAARIAAFHADIGRADAASAWGDPTHVHAPAMQNFAQIGALALARSDREALEDLRRWTELEYRRIAPLLAERKRAGFVRECHGDLHLGNIVLGADGPLLFDCIEFNPELRWIDVMSEVAFVVMDLHDRNLAGFAWRLLNAYLERSGDYEGVQVLRYYLVYRAMVRAKVAALRAQQSRRVAGVPGTVAAEYRGYLALAERMSTDRRPALALMHGLSGSGKTTVSQILIERLAAVRVRSDIERKRLAGLSSDARTGAAYAMGIYGADATRITYGRLEHIAKCVVGAGYPVIVDAAFLRRADRDRFRALSWATGASFALVRCSAPAGMLRARVAAREHSAGDASEAGVDVLDHQIAGMEPLGADEFPDALDAESSDPVAGAEAVCRQLSARFKAS